MGDTWVIPIGDTIAANASVLARHTFDDVVDMRNGQLPANQTVAAILTPKVAYINIILGTHAPIVDIKVEWTLSESNGNTIWVDTISGHGQTGDFGFNRATDLKKALEEMLLNSAQAISSAQAIRQYAQKKL